MVCTFELEVEDPPWDDWPDGSRLQTFVGDSIAEPPGRRIPSHDFGMVGFIKYLVEEVASGAIRPVMTVHDHRPLRMETMHVYKQVAVLRKARADDDPRRDWSLADGLPEGDDGGEAFLGGIALSQEVPEGIGAEGGLLVEQQDAGDA